VCFWTEVCFRVCFFVLGLFLGLKKKNITYFFILLYANFFNLFVAHPRVRAARTGFSPPPRPRSQTPLPGWYSAATRLRAFSCGFRATREGTPLPENSPPGKVPVFSSRATRPRPGVLLRRPTRGVFLPYPAPLKYPRCAILSHPGNPVACPLSRFMTLLYQIYPVCQAFL